MKQVLPVLFFILSIAGVQAQDVLFYSKTGPVTDGDTLHYTGQPDDFEIVGYTFASNNRKDDMNLRWELTNFSDQPSGWETAICDNFTCYPPAVLTNVVIGGTPDKPIQLSQGDSTNIDLHLYPNEVPGVGHAQVCISTKEAPNDVLGCLVFKFTVGGASSTVEKNQIENLEVFPNPTTEYFGLTHSGDIKDIRVYNMLGRKQRSFEAGIGKKYYVGDLPAGMYLVALADENGKVVKTTRLLKRLYRP